MEYKGTTTCSFCSKPFEFKYIEVERTKLSSGKLAEVTDCDGNIVHLNYIKDGIPSFSVLCPNCGKEHYLSQEEASYIPWSTKC